VKDLATGDLTLASVTDTGVKANDSTGSFGSDLSADGTKVVFQSFATNLDPADSSLDIAWDVYVKDLVSGELMLISTSGAGVKGNASSFSSVISSDGSRVAYASFASNLIATDTDQLGDIYVKEPGPAAVPAADLSISKRDKRDPVPFGARLVYTLVVNNLGPNSAVSVTVTDFLPSGVRFVSAKPSQGTCGRVNATLTCELGFMAFPGTASVTVIVEPTGRAPLVNTAEVSADLFDPNTTNNADIETTTVR
jgi:uncharacterized repeat protein (TIGR01451 family)